MTRLRGWAPKGERLVDKVPHGRWKTATFLAALRNDRIEAPCLFDGPINGERFRAYVEQFLTPTLKPGDVVILDNLGSHKVKAVRRRSGAEMTELLSTYTAAEFAAVVDFIERTTQALTAETARLTAKAPLPGAVGSAEIQAG